MKIIKAGIIFCMLFLAILIRASFAEEPGIKITEPKDGSIVTPGQEITVKVEAVGGFALKEGWVAIGRLEQEITILPNTTTFVIPNEASGNIILDVLGKDSSNKFVSSEITLNVRQTATLQSLEIDQEKILVGLNWDGNIKGERSGYIVTVYGIYSDGIKRDITHAGTTYVSSDSSVISIDDKGNYTINKVGTATITVSNSGVSKIIPVVFEEPRGIRPSETIPPVTQATVQPPPNIAGWNNNDITITLAATDNEGGSGVQEIEYVLAGLTGMTGILSERKTVQGNTAQVFISKDGIARLGYYATDNERNVERTQFTDIKLDKTPPQLSLTSPKQGTEYFHNQSIPLTYTATDALSGINSTSLRLDNTDITGQVNIQPRVGSHTLVLTATDKADNKATLQANFTVKLKAEVIIKPEVFLSNKGIFLAIVKFPSGYDHKTITDATCDGAPAKKIIKTKKSAIIVFRKEDITQTPIDTTFTVTGHFAKSLIFEGTDTIKRVIDKRGAKAKDEETEINKAIDECLGYDKEESKRVKKEIEKFN